MSMGQHSRVRRVTKWTGLAACGLLLAAYVLTIWGYVEYRTTRWGVRVRPGGLGISWSSSPLVPRHRGWTSGTGKAVLPDWWFDYQCRRLYTGLIISWASVPLWAFLLPCAGLTAWLWRRDWRIPPGHCRCGYDLTGNTSGRCPECGAAVSSGSCD